MIDDLGDFSGAHSTAVRNTLDKLPSYIRCVEKEYGLEIYSKNKKSKYRSLYKRENKRWQNYIWDIA